MLYRCYNMCYFISYSCLILIYSHSIIFILFFQLPCTVICFIAVKSLCQLTILIRHDKSLLQNIILNARETTVCRHNCCGLFVACFIKLLLTYFSYFNVVARLNVSTEDMCVGGRGGCIVLTLWLQ